MPGEPIPLLAAELDELKADLASMLDLAAAEVRDMGDDELNLAAAAARALERFGADLLEIVERERARRG